MTTQLCQVVSIDDAYRASLEPLSSVESRTTGANAMAMTAPAVAITVRVVSAQLGSTCSGPLVVIQVHAVPIGHHCHSAAGTASGATNEPTSRPVLVLISTAHQYWPSRCSYASVPAAIAHKRAAERASTDTTRTIRRPTTPQPDHLHPSRFLPASGPCAPERPGAR